jgi:hypothetical protein
LTDAAPGRPPAPHAGGSSPGNGFRARKGGSTVATARTVQSASGYVVEAVVVRNGQPHPAGPYHFAQLADATAFLVEAGEALTYLGCHVQDLAELG